VRKYYVEVHGDEEIRPFRADVSAFARRRRGAAPEDQGGLVALRRSRSA
jgi:hypothetical protein